MGIPLPFPDKKPSKVNNRKVTFDSMCRELLLGICREHGLEVETEAIYGGKTSREKNDYIIEKQRAEIAALKKENADLTADNERQRRMLEQKSVELDDKLIQLTDADTVLEAVADAAYEQAARVVTRIAAYETQKADQAVVDRMIAMTVEPERRMKRKEQELIIEWLTGLKNNIVKRAEKIVASVLATLRKPEYRRGAKAEIKEQAKPAVRELLRTYTSRHSQEKTAKYSRNEGAR